VPRFYSLFITIPGFNPYELYELPQWNGHNVWASQTNNE
jgi:hypothetical protein